jgi:hypothetical protein
MTSTTIYYCLNSNSALLFTVTATPLYYTSPPLYYISPPLYYTSPPLYYTSPPLYYTSPPIYNAFFYLAVLQYLTRKADRV